VRWLNVASTGGHLHWKTQCGGMSHLMLRIDAGPGSAAQAEEHRFSPEETVQIGRHGDNRVVLASPKVSRFHATLFFDGHSWHCACFGTNAMFVDGRKSTHATIQAGTRIRFSQPGATVHCTLSGEACDDEESGQTLDRSAAEQSLELIGDSLSTAPRGSISVLIDGLKEGCRDSLTELWSRCFAVIVRLARQRLGSSRRRVEDEEDVAMVVLTDLYYSSSEGRLPDLTDRKSLWRLLVTMTRNSAIDTVKRERRAKRGGGHVHGDSIAEGTSIDVPVSGPSVFDQFTRSEPTPESVAEIDEQIQLWLAGLPDDEHREVALLRMEGCSTEEIAAQMDLSLRTVERRLKSIRDLWAAGSKIEA
jgi:RNA polymerase sigma factor (sigma-70 family)